MIHKKTHVIISVTPDDDILFIKRGSRNGKTTARLATFLSYDKIPSPCKSSTYIAQHLGLYLLEKLDRLCFNEVITIDITTHKKSF